MAGEEDRAVRVNLNGVVQAVGFRPFVYRRAVSLGLFGWVKNLGDAGVEIFLQGSPESIERMIVALREENPPLAEVEEIELEEAQQDPQLEGFSILPSEEGGEGSGVIPPDIATCEQCLEEVFGSTRYEGYWATSCVNCGPRFSVIRSLPYDREKTSMKEFDLCKDCLEEYSDPLDRRHHAQTIACPQCGPRLWYEDGAGGKQFEGAIKQAAEELIAGKIIAIKGLGGTHIAARADREEVVARLRERLGRSEQPFALMATEETVLEGDQVVVSPAERETLTGPRRPIVALEKAPGYSLPENVAPGLHTVGLMLPYTALHHLLFDPLRFPLVMTSANRPGQPMYIENDEIRAGLRGIVDGLLLHEREIVSRCDDSVLRFSQGRAKFIRRSRGWVPEGIGAELGEEAVLALGAEQDNVLGVYVDGTAYLSQYLGDVDDPAGLDFLEEALGRLLELLGLDLPSQVAHDLHPNFLTTEKAKELSDDPFAVQHHVAHLGSLLVEGGQEEIVAITLDGLGYGPKGEIWGGEVLAYQGESKSVRRLGSLTPAPMPGGDLATKRPGRMVLGILYPLLERGRLGESDWKELAEETIDLLPQGEEELEAVLASLEGGLNAPLTSSAGRFLDAVSAYLGLCEVRTYEGEPAMKLESFARGVRPAAIPLPLVEGKADRGRYLFDQSKALLDLIELEKREGAKKVAATAQWMLAEGMASLACRIAEDLGITTLGLSGGVAFNEFISNHIESVVRERGYDFVINESVPPGDGGIALGQLWAAAEGVQLRS